MNNATRHCHKCGWIYPRTENPGRTEACLKCGEDLRVCLNCAGYDTRAAQQCRERDADPVEDKHTGNFCEFFDFARRVFVPNTSLGSREAEARDRLKRLLGD